MSIRSPLLSDHLAAKLTDPTSALAAAFIIANRHLEILQWVARMIGVEPPPKPNGVGNGAKPPPVRKRRGAGATPALLKAGQIGVGASGR
jgi:hypothetical protein